MHAGADVEAFTAELNRDIQEANTQQQPSNSDTDAQDVQKLQNMSNQCSRAMSMELNDQQSLSRMNQHTQQPLKSNKQVAFGTLLPIIEPQLDKDRAMQLNTLYIKLKKNEILKDDFMRHMRSIVGDQMLKIAVYKLQTQGAKNSENAPNQFQSQPHGGPSSATGLSNPTTKSDTTKSWEMESQSDSTPSSSAFPTQGLNKQQHVRYSPFSAPNGPYLSSAVTANCVSMTNMPKFDRPYSFNDPKKTHGGSLAHMNSNSILYVKQEPVDQSNEHHKSQFSSSHGIPFKQGNAAPRSLNDECFEIQSSRTGFTPPTTVSNSRMLSLTSPIGPGNNSMAPLKKPLVGQKTPMEAPCSSPPSSKKQKVSGDFLDQSIEHLNDVTAVSGVNLRDEEEQLFSGPKEDNRVSQASRRVVQEEEERLILHKIPLQKKVVEIMSKCGLKSMSSDVERCLSLCVEERMRGLIANLIRLSKQRVDVEKPRHRTIVTSDVRKQIMIINRKARAEWEKKQAEIEKSLKQNDPESSNGVDGGKEKDENRAKLAKANKEEADKMRATAAVRAATGSSDMLSRWQLMIEAKQKQDVTARKPLQASTTNTRQNQLESDKRDFSSTHALVRKVGRNQVVVPRSISVKDVIAILEREPQMLKSTLLYRLYNRNRALFNQ